MKTFRLRSLSKDYSGVSEVVGGSMMIAITVSIMATIMASSGAFIAMQTQQSQAQQREMQAMVYVMDNFTAYLRGYHFGQGPGGNDSTDPPYVDYEFNETTQNWDFYYCQGHSANWTRLNPITPNGQIASPPQYTLIINIMGHGTVIKSPQYIRYSSGTVVHLNATGYPGFYFIKWSGDLSTSINPTSITMNSNKTVCAVFENINT